jgi:excinuclease ABC subunit C
MADHDQILREKVAALPEEPGVYRFFDQEGTIIYVGKAKSLRKRVSSYFMNKSQLERKTRRLVSLITNLEYTVVTTEFDALLLENNLIKQYQPRYNILLKDDKSYPYVVVTNDAYPRIYTTRKLRKGEGTYFGPYASGRTMGTVLELIKKVYTLRSCSLPLNTQNVTEGKFKVCLEYHIGNCKGPCENLQPQAEYRQEVDEAIHILKGNLAPAKQYFRELMQGYAEKMEFEKAHRAKLRLESLEDYQNKSIVSNPNWPDVDVVTLIAGEDVCYINYMRIQFGVVNLTMNYEIKRKLDDPDQPAEDILTQVYLQLRQTYNSEAKEVLSNLGFTTELPGISHHIPQIGDKKKLIDMSVRNALYFKKDQLGLKEEKQTEKREDRILAKLQLDLRLQDIPDHIECFDNSNIQGTNPVAAMVCFKNGKPSKKDYRHFHIKTVIGPDDFASMDEIVSRRYARLVAEEQPLPKLIIIDGGKGQLSAACEALKRVGVYGKIPIVGIAKRLEEIYYPEDPLPLYIEKKSEGLRLIQQIRDETHRFAITFHRDTRSKNSIKSRLEGIKGIGLNTADKVYKHFKSFKNITPDRLPELEALIGKAKAKLMMDKMNEG